MSHTPHLAESIVDGVATLTMNRPEARNAMSGEMIQGLMEALPRLAMDANVRCVVLTGAGSAFCAGGDVKGFAAASDGAGYEGHRGWINYLAVEPDHRRKSYGRLMMAAAEQLLGELGCPKINLQVRSANGSVGAFYESLGFSTDEVVSMGKRLRID